jgi:site-specific recombinase XerD
MSKAIVVHQPSSALAAVDGRHIERDPHKAYLRSLSTERSRQSMFGALARVTRRYFQCEPAEFDWQRLDFEIMDALRTKLSEDFGLRTARHALSALRGVLRYAARMKLISREQYSDAIDLKPIKGFETETGRALTSTELARVRAYCDELGDPLVSAVLLGALFGAGVRAQEAASLGIGAFCNRTLIVPGKGLKTRVVPLHSSAQAHFTRWIEYRKTLPEGPHLFVTTKGPLSRWLIWKLVRTTSRATGIQMTPHDCRRTFATEFIRRSGDISAVQRLLGHAKPETTARYDKRGADELARFVERFGG